MQKSPRTRPFGGGGGRGVSFSEPDMGTLGMVQEGQRSVENRKGRVRSSFAATLCRFLPLGFLGGILALLTHAFS